MAINFAEKYQSAVDERFALAALTNAAVNGDYDWAGVETVNVYSLPTAAMNDYNMTGLSRYGTPAELQDTIQTMKIQKDRSFTFTIDRKSYDDTVMTRESGRALRRQVDEVVIPEIDTYRLSKMVAGAGTKSTPAAITKNNAYDAFLSATSSLVENKVPLSGTVAFAGTNFYKCIRQDAAFIQAAQMPGGITVTGQVGMVDGIPVIYVPSVYLPAKVEFLLCNRMAVVAVNKLAEYRVHENPPGINGWLVEGRVRYDAFVLANKSKAIYVHETV